MFLLVLGYSESELNSVYLVGFLSLLGRFWNFLRVSINHLDRLGNQTSRFIWFSLLERQFGWFDLFVLVLGYSESELNSVCLVGFLSLLVRFLNFLRVSINHLYLLGKQNQPVHLVQFAGTAVWVV